MEAIGEVLKNLSGNLIDVLIYAAIAIVTVLGIVKCVLPIRGSIHCLRRAIRVLDKSPIRDRQNPVWENELFMGRQMSGAWRRFLQNAQQLDARGMTCDVRDYINDDTAIYDIGNVPLSEMIPGILTSLGILGTFLGLMRGLGGLDVSDATRTMESIPGMIGGMSFAFSTSIAGVGCSLLFQLLNRMAMGGASNALTDFQEAFSETAMQIPLNTDTRAICQREDQSLFLRHVVNEMSDTMADRVSGAIEQSFVPLAQQMNSFIAGQTQGQLDGLNMIARRFIDAMNQQLGGSFLQLGQTLTEINRSQKASFDAVDRSMATADQVIQDLSHVQQVTAEITHSFDSYMKTLAESREREDEFNQNALEVINQLGYSARQQSENLEQIYAQQENLRANIQDFALRSKQSLQTIVDRADLSGRDAGEIADQMKESGQLLKTSYAKLVENVTASFGTALEDLNRNVAALTDVMKKRANELGKAGAASSDARVITALSDLSQTAARIEEALKTEGTGAA